MTNNTPVDNKPTNDNGNKPTNKVTLMTAASAVVILLVWVLSFWEIDVPNEAQGAFTTILIFIVGYITRDKNNGN